MGVSVTKPTFQGMGKPSFGSPSPGVAQPSPTQSAYNNYGSAAKSNQVDYSDIMQRYRNLDDQLKSGIGNGNTNLQYNYTVPTYQTTQDYKNSIANLSDLAKTGGYSASDIANIRERGISPIRTVYANAQRGLDRSRSLAGGYSPNYAAVSAKMAREMSSQLSDATTNVNAQIAQNVAANRIATGTPLANVTAGEQAERNKFSLDAAEMANRFGLNNLNFQQQQLMFPIQSRLSALGGMTSLYGTTPATTSLMQNGAINTAALQNNIKQGNQANNLRTIAAFSGV